MPRDDGALIERIRAILKQHEGYSEKKMFGGVAFMIGGNMCCGPWANSLIVRLAKEDHDETQAEPHVKPMDITGKVMRGWAMIEPAGIEADDQLKAWVRRAVKFAASLPAKS